MQSLAKSTGISGPDKKDTNVKHRIYSQDEALWHVTQLRSTKQQHLYLITDHILYFVWDALCLSINEDFREKYLPFLPHVFDLLLKTTDGDDIYDYFLYIEKRWCDSAEFDNLSKMRASRVVETLLDYRETIFSDKEQPDMCTINL